jgi:hypothetical protein
MSTCGSENESLAVLKDFTLWQMTRYGLEVKIIQSDNELNRGRTRCWMRDQGIAFEPLVPETYDQNGVAERLGGVIMAKARSMRIGAKLPHNLWKEIVDTAVYLYGRTPRHQSNWKSHELFYTYLAELDKFHGPRKPQLAHLKAFGCRAYAMTKNAQVKKQRPNCWETGNTLNRGLY